MTIYPLDIAAEQIVRWLMEEQRSGRLGLTVSTYRTYLAEEVTGAQQRGLGEEEKENLSEVTAVGLLEVSPPLNYNGWLLRVRIEDPLGPRLPEGQTAVEAEDKIDLTTFHEQFVLPDRATAYVNLEAETSAAWSRFQDLLDEIRIDRHPGR